MTKNQLWIRVNESHFMIELKTLLNNLNLSEIELRKKYETWKIQLRRLLMIVEEFWII
jgi:hypothetical protein